MRLPTVRVSVVLVLFVMRDMACGEETIAPLSLDDVVSGRATLVDLTYSLNDHSPYWPGESYQPFKLVTIATLEKDVITAESKAMEARLSLISLCRDDVASTVNAYLTDLARLPDSAKP